MLIMTESDRRDDRFQEVPPPRRQARRRRTPQAYARSAPPCGCLAARLLAGFRLDTGRYARIPRAADPAGRVMESSARSRSDSASPRGSVASSRELACTSGTFITTSTRLPRALMLARNNIDSRTARHEPLAALTPGPRRSRRSVSANESAAGAGPMGAGCPAAGNCTAKLDPAGALPARVLRATFPASRLPSSRDALEASSYDDWSGIHKQDGAGQP